MLKELKASDMEMVDRSRRVCPVELAGHLDSRFRRLFQNPEKILRPYIRAGMTVLDLGCGPGYFTVEAAKLLNGSGKVIAADVQPGMLEIVRGKIKGTEMEHLIELHLTSENTLRPDLNVGFILAFYVVHEIENHQALFRELRTAIASGGKLLIVEPAFHVSGKEFREMIRNLEDSGFEVISRPFMPLSRVLVAKPV